MLVRLETKTNLQELAALPMFGQHSDQIKMLIRSNFLLCLLLLVTSSAKTIAQVSEVQMRGTVYFAEYGEDLLFYVNEIANTNLSDSTGKLRLELWLTDTPYSGGLLRGIRFAELDIDPIQAGMSLNGIEKIAKLRGFPKKGSYYGAFVLYEEKGSLSEQMADWVAFDDPVAFGQAALEGGGSLLRLAYNRIRINLDGIKSELPLNSASRPLRLVLRGYLNADPSIRDLPTIMAIIDVPPVSPGTSITEISLEDFLFGPKDGTYYLYLVLQEFAFGRWVDADQLVYAEPWILTTPIPDISLTLTSTISIVVDWTVEPGYRYTLQSSVDFDTWTEVQDPVSVRSAGMPALSASVISPGFPSFYRVLVERLLF